MVSQDFGRNQRELLTPAEEPVCIPQLLIQLSNQLDQLTAAITRLVNCTCNPMAPWDEMAFFGPQQTFLSASLPTGVVTLVAPAEPKRIAIQFGMTGTGTVYLNTSQGFGSTLASGMPLLNTSGVWQLTQAQHGPIVQQPWYANPSAAGQMLFVLGTVLQTWPNGG